MQKTGHEQEVQIRHGFKATFFKSCSILKKKKNSNKLLSQRLEEHAEGKKGLLSKATNNKSNTLSGSSQRQKNTQNTTKSTPVKNDYHLKKQIF